MKEKILVVDDESDIVELISYNLKKENFDVLTASDGLEALEITQKSKPDLVILDIMMPGLDGFEVCKRIRQNNDISHIGIIFLTAKAAEIDQILGLELGADDYLQKPISPRVLLARVKNALRHNTERVKTETIVAPEVIKIDDLEINRQNYNVKINNVETFFPKKEFELLAFLVSNLGKVFSRELLLKRIWGESVYVVDRTVDVHISKIREKLGDYGERLETVKGVGYRFRN